MLQVRQDGAHVLHLPQQEELGAEDGQGAAEDQGSDRMSSFNKWLKYKDLLVVLI